jgi:SH3 domain-containing YSC84-like protein 1
MRKLLGFLLVVWVGTAAFAGESTSEAKTLDRAREVIREAVEAPDRGIPKELLERAECVGVFPDVAKGAFVVGGEFGRGVFTCREESGNLGAPAFFTIGGASFGWQFGGQEADLVLLVMNRKGMDHLLKDNFALGAEASATAGPLGRTAKAATDAQLQAEILSWSRSQGAFLGVSLNGTVIKPHEQANARFYGHEASAREILAQSKFHAPAAAKGFLTTANVYSKR